MKNLHKVMLCITVLAGIVLVINGCDGRHPENPTGWAVGDSVDGYGAILNTIDAGENWVRQGSAQDIPAVNLYDASAIDAHKVWVVGANCDGYGVILRTEDGGENWVRQGSAQQIPDVEFLGVSAHDKHTAWVVGMQGTILHTTDGGKTWIRQAKGMAPDAELQVVYAVDSRNVWAVGKGSDAFATILRTSDGGDTWVRKGSAEDVPTNHLIDISAVDSSTAWAAGGDYSFLLTTDGGISWTNHQPVMGLYDANGVCAVDLDTIWFVTDNDGIYYTTDGGVNWTKQTPPVYGYYLMGVSAMDGQRAWVVGTAWVKDQKGVILHTSDGGDTWTEQIAPVNTRLRRISFVDARK